MTDKAVCLRRIEKADIWQLWEWHSIDRLYLFGEFDTTLSFDFLIDNFENYFNGHKDFIIEDNKNKIIGVCSFHNFFFENRTCDLSIRFKENDIKKNVLLNILQHIIDLLFDEMNIRKITTKLAEGNAFELEILKEVGFYLEGVLREHIYKNGSYFDTLVFSLIKRIN